MLQKLNLYNHRLTNYPKTGNGDGKSLKVLKSIVKQNMDMVHFQMLEILQGLQMIAWRASFSEKH